MKSVNNIYFLFWIFFWLPKSSTVVVFRDTLQELERTYKAPETVTSAVVKADKFNAAHYSTGQLPTLGVWNNATHYSTHWSIGSLGSLELAFSSELMLF